jgi:hypothetical protein
MRPIIIVVTLCRESTPVSANSTAMRRYTQSSFLGISAAPDQRLKSAGTPTPRARRLPRASQFARRPNESGSGREKTVTTAGSNSTGELLRMDTVADPTTERDPDFRGITGGKVHA